MEIANSTNAVHAVQVTDYIEPFLKNICAKIKTIWELVEREIGMRTKKTLNIAENIA